jgi:hypothetical protein
MQEQRLAQPKSLEPARSLEGVLESRKLFTKRDTFPAETNRVAGVTVRIAIWLCQAVLRRFTRERVDGRLTAIWLNIM